MTKPPGWDLHSGLLDGEEAPHLKEHGLVTVLAFQTRIDGFACLAVSFKLLFHKLLLHKVGLLFVWSSVMVHFFA